MAGIRRFMLIAAVLTILGATFATVLMAIGIAGAVSEADPALQSARSLPVASADDDRGRLFATLHADGAFDLDQIDRRLADAALDLRRARFLIVPGYLTDFLVVPQSLGLVAHFDGQVAALQDAGFEVEIVEIESEASVRQGAEALRAAIEADDRPVFLLSHSKGGLDTLDYLIHADPATRARVVCWIALQAPFAGSPVADGVASQELLRWPSEAALELFGGDGQSLHDHRMDTRADYLAEHADAISEIVGQVPILSVAGRVDQVPLPSKHALLANWLNGEGIPNDGMVPTWSSVLPGSAFLVVDGLDHTGAVLDHLFARSADRIAMTKALLLVALQTSDP